MQPASNSRANTRQKTRENTEPANTTPIAANADDNDGSNAGPSAAAVARRENTEVSAQPKRGKCGPYDGGSRTTRERRDHELRAIREKLGLPSETLRFAEKQGAVASDDAPDVALAHAQDPKAVVHQLQVSPKSLDGMARYPNAGLERLQLFLDPLTAGSLLNDVELATQYPSTCAPQQTLVIVWTEDDLAKWLKKHRCPELAALIPAESPLGPPLRSTDEDSGILTFDAYLDRYVEGQRVGVSGYTKLPTAWQPVSFTGKSTKKP